MSNGIAILGSARGDGNTSVALRRLVDGLGCHVFDLGRLDIAPFDYAQTYPDGDQFMAVVREVVVAPLTVFATPVYWYSYSSVMKQFIDRLSDLLKSQKEWGRRLRGRRFALLTTSSESAPDPDLVSAFGRLCGYLGVGYVGCVHAEAGGPFADPEAVRRVRGLLGTT